MTMHDMYDFDAKVMPMLIDAHFGWTASCRAGQSQRLLYVLTA
jgi:hypothetical protein